MSFAPCLECPSICLNECRGVAAPGLHDQDKARGKGSPRLVAVGGWRAQGPRVPPVHLARHTPHAYVELGGILTAYYWGELGAGPTVTPRTVIGPVTLGLPISVDLAHVHSLFGTLTIHCSSPKIPIKERPSPPCRNFLNPNSNKFSLRPATPSPGLLRPRMMLRRGRGDR